MSDKSGDANFEARVWREFLLKTNGKNPELDGIGICLDALEGLPATARFRIIRYLCDRYNVRESNPND